MKITFKGDYALKTILDLSWHFGNSNVVPLNEIAERNDIPLQFLEQIMLTLKGAGFVDSKRGKGGGFFLTKSPEDITVGDIVRAIEGPIEPIACVEKGKSTTCAESNACAFREIWVSVTEATSNIVDTVTFAFLMQRTEELKSENHIHDYQI